MRRLLRLAAFPLLVAVPLPTSTLSELLQKVKSEFRNGSYPAALDTLAALEAESRKPGVERGREALVPIIAFYRGASLAALGRKDEAIAELQAFLAYQPNASLEPFATVGRYGAFQRLASPRDPISSRRFDRLSEGQVSKDPSASTIGFHLDGDGTIDSTLPAPGGEQRSFNGSLVLRWVSAWLLSDSRVEPAAQRHGRHNDELAGRGARASRQRQADKCLSHEGEPAARSVGESKSFPAGHGNGHVDPAVSGYCRRPFAMGKLPAAMCHQPQEDVR